MNIYKAHTKNTSSPLPIAIKSIKVSRSLWIVSDVNPLAPDRTLSSSSSMQALHNVCTSMLPLYNFKIYAGVKYHKLQVDVLK